MVAGIEELSGASPNADPGQLVSDLMDGRVLPAELDDALLGLFADERALVSWKAYHVIGDTLKSGNQPLPLVTPQFVSKVRARIDLEIMSGGRSARQELEQRSAGRPDKAGRNRQADAANESLFLWRAVAGVAVFVAVGALAWSAIENPGLREGAQIAARSQGNPSSSLGSGGTVILRDPVLDEMLAAHRQVSGASALQMPAGFVRNAAFDSTHR